MFSFGLQLLTLVGAKTVYVHLQGFCADILATSGTKLCNCFQKARALSLMFFLSQLN